MATITKFLRSCPTITTGTLTAIVAASIGLLVAFGADLDEDQRIAVMSLVAALAPLIVGGITKVQTVPSNQVIAHETPEGDVLAGQAADQPTGAPIDVTTEPRTESDAEAGEV